MDKVRKERSAPTPITADPSKTQTLNRYFKDLQ